MKILDVTPERKDRYDEMRKREKRKRSYNPERARAYQAEYREKNREKIRAYAREYYQKNREKHNAYYKQYKRDNPEWYLQARIRSAINLLKKHGYSVTKQEAEDGAE